MRTVSQSDFDRVIFVPVIHVDEESVKCVRETIQNTRPDVVAVELDRQRYELLISGEQPAQQPDSMPATGNVAQDFMNQIAMLEVTLGGLTGSQAGSEMLAAIDAGRAIGAKIALIDRPIQETSAALMRVPLDELYRFMGMFESASADLQDSPLNLLTSLRDDETVDSLLEEFEHEFPAIYDALLRQRDRYIANALHYILNDVNGLIVAVLGAGHIDGVKQYLAELLAGNAE